VIQTLSIKHNQEGDHISVRHTGLPGGRFKINTLLELRKEQQHNQKQG
jgi:hypothetical protein